METKLPKWLKQSGYNVGFFKQAVIEEFCNNQKFDVVYSIGFIEHFENYHLSLWQKMVRYLFL